MLEQHKHAYQIPKLIGRRLVCTLFEQVLDRVNLDCRLLIDKYTVWRVLFFPTYFKYLFYAISRSHACFARVFTWALIDRLNSVLGACVCVCKIETQTNICSATVRHTHSMRQTQLKIRWGEFYIWRSHTKALRPFECESFCKPCTFSSYFSHFHFSKSKEFESLQQKILSIIQIWVKIRLFRWFFSHASSCPSVGAIYCKYCSFLPP